MRVKDFFRGRNRIMGLAALMMAGLTLCSCVNGGVEVEEGQIYAMPSEEATHEGTWLQWPHDYTYGEGYRDSVENIWVEMTRSLVGGERVHIVAHDKEEKAHIEKILDQEGVDETNVDFFIYPTDDVWVRDNGPIFVYDASGKQVILDWGFNGWGNKTPYKNCDKIPEKISADIGIERIDLKNMVLEGGAFELDGKGTLLAARSSVTNKNRNPHLTEKEMEQYLRQYFGVKNFIWIDGVEDPADVTDFHIDGIAKFYGKNSVITLQEEDLYQWGTKERDAEIIHEMKNAQGEYYEKIYLPLTWKTVKLADGYELGYKGSYINYYVGNTVVLVPNYADKNDEIANKIIQELYPTRKVIGIDVRELYQYGGMIHCITQQQPKVVASKGDFQYNEGIEATEK